MYSKIYRIKTKQILNQDLRGALVRVVATNSIGLICECVDTKLKRKYGELAFYFKIEDLEEVKVCEEILITDQK